MAQAIPPFCPRCGKATVAGQRFCTHCGLVMSPASTAPTIIDDPDIPTQPIQFDMASPQASQPNTQPAWSPPTMNPTSPPPFSPPPTKRKRGRIGLLLALLVLLLVIGLGSYIAFGVLGIHLGSPNGGTQPPITTTQLNTTVTYAGVNLTIQHAQQADSFVNDPNTATDGMVRLTIQEQNPTAATVSWLYSDIARLILPNKNAVAPTFVKAKVGIAPAATQTSFVDFAVPSSTKINQLSVRLGAANEAQMTIPLTAHADVSKYAPKSVKLNGPMPYLGLNYTLTNAIAQLSIAGQQASKGNVYIVVTLKVDNPLSQQAIPGSAYDYVRLKTGNSTATPKDTTLPVSFDTGETGNTGTVTFLMPQGSNAFTLLLLPQSGADQASTAFQLS
ncbi:MAG: zinc ribbon domain-containing protein [Ktedonobacteraceae bacterium]